MVDLCQSITIEIELFFFLPSILMCILIQFSYVYCFAGSYCLACSPKEPHWNDSSWFNLWGEQYKYFFVRKLWFFIVFWICVIFLTCFFYRFRTKLSHRMYLQHVVCRWLVHILVGNFPLWSLTFFWVKYFFLFYWFARCLFVWRVFFCK